MFLPFFSSTIDIQATLLILQHLYIQFWNPRLRRFSEVWIWNPLKRSPAKIERGVLDSTPALLAFQSFPARFHVLLDAPRTTAASFQRTRRPILSFQGTCHIPGEPTPLYYIHVQTTQHYTSTYPLYAMPVVDICIQTPGDSSETSGHGVSLACNSLYIP